MNVEQKPEKKARKRGAGEGSIFKRADGRWSGSVTIGQTETGKQRKRVVYGATRSEVGEKLRELSNDVAEGTLADPRRLRVEDLVRRYLDHTRASVRPRVYQSYEQRLRVHVLPRIGKLSLRCLAPLHVLDVAASLRRVREAEAIDDATEKSAKKGKARKPRTLAPRSQRDVLDVFSRVLDFGVRSGLLPRNPARGLPRPKLEAPRIQSLSAGQARKLLAKARESEPWVEAAVALGLCGLRLGETFGLAWGDVDLRGGRVRVRQALAELDDGTRELVPPKTKSARRELALPSWARSALGRHLKSLPAAPHPTRLVFVTEAGTPVRMSNFRRRHFDPLATRAELTGTTYHALRHTCATLLLGGGADAKSAQRVLGHAKAAHTLDVYADFVPDNVDAAMTRLERALRG